MELYMVASVIHILRKLHEDESGQGLIEYLLILALVAFASVAGMSTLASALNQAFSSIGSLVNAYIS
jgi:pilus assembly protein Flp/PilA